MDRLDKRMRKLIHILSNAREHQTAEKLSQLFNVSTKTIYRWVKQINDDPTMDYRIVAEKGKGYRLAFDPKKQPKDNQSFEATTPVERRTKIMEELLLASPYQRKVTDLYENFYVSDSVIHMDEKIMAETLAKFDLKLTHRNKMMFITGQENKIRRALNELVQNTRFLSLDELQMSENVLNEFDAKFVREQLMYIEAKGKLTIPFPYNVNIFSHLYILLSRFRKVGNAFISMDTNEIPGMKEEEYAQLFEIAVEVIVNFEKYLNTVLPSNESYYLYQYLVSSRMQRKTETTTAVNSLVKVITEQLIDRVGEHLSYHFNKEKIYPKLSKHVKPLLNRLEHGIVVKNNLLEQIKLEYARVFLAIEEEVAIISRKYHIGEINEDEIGFISLYFAQALEDQDQPIRVAVVCTTGIGTSELLKVKLTKRFPELTIAQVLASRNIQDELLDKEIDLIISTIDLPEIIEIPSILVSAMLNYDDQQRLEKLIQQLKGW